MSIITEAHFGANIVLINDSATLGSPYREMMKEITFTHFRYPGGTVTEQQTWANGGLEKMFGPPMNPGSDGYVMTIREAMQLSIDFDCSLTIVTPTFQFYDETTDSFDIAGFERYAESLEEAFLEYPKARITGFEIGNEYWAKHGGIDAVKYGFIANNELPILNALNQRMHDLSGDDWEGANIGIQAGAEWHAIGVRDSQKIAKQILIDNRTLIDSIYQHRFPNYYHDFEKQKDMTIDPMDVFGDIEGFRGDLKYNISEFNMYRKAGDAEIYGVNQGGLWIEEFSRYIDAGVDSFDHWGINYEWLTNKFYDQKFPYAESNNGEIVTIATPMGQVYDLASSQLIGKSTISDIEALEGIDVSDEIGVTGFEGDGQRLVFLSNMSGTDAQIDIGSVQDDAVVNAHHLVAADSPFTQVTDESTLVFQADENGNAKPLDPRGDMQVTGGAALKPTITIGNNELLVLSISDPDKDLILEGAHNVTDPRTGMVDDVISGGNGRDILWGHVGNDELHGSAGSDLLIGGRDNDTLFGEYGDDILVSSAGTDVLDGGRGNDVLVIRHKPTDDVVTVKTGDGNDLIMTKGGRDIVIEDFQADKDMLGLGGTFASRSELNEATRAVGGDLIITLPDETTITLKNAAFDDSIARSARDGTAGEDEYYFDFLPSDAIQNILDKMFDPMSESQIHHAFPVIEAKIAPEHQENIIRFIEHYLPTSGKPTENPSGADDSVEALGYDKSPVGNDDEDVKKQPDQVDCFIATAVYGNPRHPDVVALRAFRDLHLIRFKFGRAFIQVYWRVGPTLATQFKTGSISGNVCRYVLSKAVSILTKFNLTG